MICEFNEGPLGMWMEPLFRQSQCQGNVPHLRPHFREGWEMTLGNRWKLNDCAVCCLRDKFREI